MIIFITDKQVRKNFKKFGCKNIDAAVVELINKTLFNFVTKKMKKVTAKNKALTRFDAIHFQNGGRVLFPSEYFGVPSNHYVASPANNGVDMSVKDTWIRPPMDLMRPLEGGKEPCVFQVPLQAIKSAAAEVSYSKDIALTLSAYKELQSQYEKIMTEVVEKVVKAAAKSKTDIIKKADVSTVLSMKKFAVLI
jgi:histone H3/H4